MKWTILFIVLLGCLFWMLYEPDPAKEDVVGMYAGEHNGFEDQVELKSDQRFTQILKTPDGQTINSSGTWTLSYKSLDLNGYVFFIEEQVEGSSEKPIKTSVTFAAHEGMLVRDWGSGFYKLTRK